MDHGPRRTAMVPPRPAVAALLAAALALAPLLAEGASSAAWTQDGAPRATAVQGLGLVGSTLLASTFAEGTWRSADGGATWEPILPPPAVSKGRFASDPTRPSVAYLAGIGGVARTQDGGATWEHVLAVQRAARIDVSLTGAVVVGARFADASNHVLVSHDLGQSWQDLAAPLPPVEPICGVAFAPHDNVILAMTDERSWYTHDGGLTWHETPGAGFEFAIEDDGTVWRSDATSLERTTDGGLTWQALAPPGFGVAIAPRPGGGAVLGSNAGLLATRDGLAWEPRGHAPAMVGAHGALALDGEVVLVADERRGVQRIAPSPQGWGFEGLNVGPPAALDHLAGDAALLLAGSPLGAWASRDGGASWAHTGAGLGAPPHAIAAAGVHAYVGSANVLGTPVVEASADGGRTWTQAALPGGIGQVVALAAHTDGRAWAAVRTPEGLGRVLHTPDGGDAWDVLLEGPVVHDLAAGGPGEVLAATALGTFALQGSAALPLGATGPTAAVATGHGRHYAASSVGPGLWRGEQAMPLLLPWASPGALRDVAAGEGDAWAVTSLGALLRCTDPGALCSEASPPGAEVRAALEARGRVLVATPQGLWATAP
jgi:hypothetical protein